MNRPADMNRRFYQGDQLHTVLRVGGARLIFRTPDFPLAELEDSSTPTLLAIDYLESILLEHAKQTVSPVSYSPYGHSDECSPERVLGFTGQARDLQARFYFLGNGYRAFSPQLMRFTAPDSYSPFGQGGLNCYAYCADDPVNFTDPTGHISDGALRQYQRTVQNQRTESVIKRGPHVGQSRMAARSQPGKTVSQKPQGVLAHPYQGRGGHDEKPSHSQLQELPALVAKPPVQARPTGELSVPGNNIPSLSSNVPTLTNEMLALRAHRSPQANKERGRYVQYYTDVIHATYPRVENEAGKRLKTLVRHHMRGIGVTDKTLVLTIYASVYRTRRGHRVPHP